jgi:hypothetical protein
MKKNMSAVMIALEGSTEQEAQKIALCKPYSWQISTSKRC